VERKPLDERTRAMLDVDVKTVWLTCSKCNCEFEVTEKMGAVLSVDDDTECYECFQNDL